MTPATQDEIIWRHLRELPFYRAVLRAVEDTFYQGQELPEPVLDLGCGDGHFASVAFPEPLDVGLDPDCKALGEARVRKAYRMTVCAEGGRLPFPDAWFGSAISNSVLEHVSEVEPVLTELSRVIRPGGYLVVTLPNDRFNQGLLGGQVFRRLGMRGASAAYVRFFNRIARHQHIDAVSAWQDHLERAGFTVEKRQDYFPPRSLHWLELGHLCIPIAYLSKRLTGRWVPFGARWARWLPYQVMRRVAVRPLDPEGVCTFLIACRAGQPAREA